MKVSKYIRGFIGLAFFGILAYLAMNLGTKTNYWGPLGIDPIVSGIHLGSLNREEIIDIGSNPADLTIQLIEKNNENESIESSVFIENPVKGNAFKSVVKNNLLGNDSSILPENLIGEKSLFKDNINYNHDNLQSTINNLKAFNIKTVPTVGANVEYNSDSNQFYPVSEQIGTEVDRNLLTNKIITTLEDANGDEEQIINLETDKIYKQPKVVYGSAKLNDLVNQLNNSLNASLTYDIGWHSFDINAPTYAPWMKIDDNGEIYLDQSLLKDYLSELSVGSDIYTSKEEALNNKQVLTGYLINYATEAVEDRNAILTNTSVTRTLPEFEITIDDIVPIYTQQYQERLNQINQELGPEFVYINLDEQFMWYYKDNQLVVGTPITSGTDDTSYSTPTGYYEVQGKSTNVTLKGENADGSKYESPVVYWVPFNGSIGIHDADNWRSSYGLGVNEYNGSHGCVNTPRSKMKIIYENISYDCPILVEGS